MPRVPLIALVAEMHRCTDCRRFQRLIDHDLCSEERRCVGDTRLAELAYYYEHALDLERFKALREAVGVGLIMAQSKLFPGMKSFPTTADEFLDAAREFHLTIFGGTSLPFAGRFRIDGESIEVDKGRYRFKGAEPEHIEGELRSMFGRIQTPYDDETRALVARRCALMFELFFDVHPFQDGNGRVARMLARWLVLIRGATTCSHSRRTDTAGCDT